MSNASAPNIDPPQSDDGSNPRWGTWRETGPHRLELDEYNATTFDPVTTGRLRVTLETPQRRRGGAPDPAVRLRQALGPYELAPPAKRS